MPSYGEEKEQVLQGGGILIAHAGPLPQGSQGHWRDNTRNEKGQKAVCESGLPGLTQALAH